MNITLNGKEHTITTGASIADLLSSLGLAKKPNVVELNKTALFPRDYKNTLLSEKDRVEIITVAAGG